MEPQYKAKTDLNKYILLTLGLIIVFALTYSVLKPSSSKNEVQESAETKVIDESDKGADTKTVIDEPVINNNTTEVNVDLQNLTKEEILTKYNGKLVDVTGGKTIRGHDFSDSPEGTFQFYIAEDNTYNLFAQVQKLPELQNGEFYEGWIVQASPFKFVSTGKLEKVENGIYVNNFTSPTDYSNYNMYVLTLEPNDDNPAPADHIVEGFSMDIEE